MKTSPNSISSSQSSDDGVQRLRIVHGIVNNWRATPVSMTEETSKDQPRPPVYNPEDYAVALKKFTKRSPPPSEAADSADSNGDQQNGGGGEMSLRQFSSASELLNKLKTDLRVAYPSFVQEFVGDPIDGVNLLLELLKCIQATQSHQQGRAPPPVLRRSLIDENACLLCLLHCLRCQDSGRILATSASGLYALAVATMSNVTKSRITALQLLTRTCETPDSKGHTQVSEAMSTLRLKFGEPVRFQFLIGMIVGSNTDLIQTGLKFLNTFIRTAPSTQAKLYIQAEIMQAGLNIDLVRKTCQNSEFVAQEINTWEKNFIDLETMRKSGEDTKQENLALREKIALLERKIQKLHEEKSALLNIENQWKDRYNKMLDKKHRNKDLKDCDKDDKRNTINVEDEGISSSELEEDIKRISDEEMENEDRIKIIKDESEDEEKEIVPTKLLPQPPRKYIINYCDHDGDEEDANQRINGFFDDDDEISENSNYYCTQNTLVTKKQDTNLADKPQLNASNMNKIKLNITSPRNSHQTISSSDNSSNSNSDDSNRSFNYYIQNTTQVKNTDTIRSRDQIEENNIKTNVNNKPIKVNSNEPHNQSNTKSSTNKLINNIRNDPKDQIKIKNTQNSLQHDERYKHENKSMKPSFQQPNYKQLVFNKPPSQQAYDSRIKPHKENADKYSSRDQPMEIQHDRNIILKRSETFHNVQNRIHNYQNVTTRSNNSNPVQSIVKPRRNNIPVNTNHYEDTQSENIKKNMNHQYNIRRSSFDGLFYITANGNQNKTSTNTTSNRENDNVNMINSNYFNYVNIKFNNNANNNTNTNGTTSTASSSKKYKSLEGISDGLESMVDIVMTGNGNGANTQMNDARRGHIYKNIKYDKKNGSPCKLSDLPSGLY